MSEVDKLYENVGIKLGCCKYAEYGYEGEEGTWYYCKKEGKECWTYPNGNANCVEKGYPPFTAEKQLEIVKMILFSTWWKNLKILQFSEKFDEGLAQIINSIWQDLTEKEKQQVKGILE